jgi:hypothetical protein
MIDACNAVLVQLESRRIFLSTLANMFVVPTTQILDLEHESRVTCLSILFQRRSQPQCIPAARSFLQAEPVVAV